MTARYPFELAGLLESQMVEVLWVTIFGAALAWLQANNAEPERVEVPIDDEWKRWEEEIHDWRQT